VLVSGQAVGEDGIVHFGVVELWACLLACAPGTGDTGDTATPNEFVEVDGKQFVLRGEPYRYVGTNVWYAAYLGRDDEHGGDRTRLVREFDLLRANGITNLRILGAAERSPLDNSMSPAISYRGEVEQEDILVGLDFALAEMAKRDMKAVIFLNNFWEWSGGMVTYLSWVNGGEYINLGDPAHPWPEFALFSAQFYSNADAQALFRKYVAQIVGRRNTITGEEYADDPTIMSWQLANEPRPGDRGGATGRRGIHAARVVPWSLHPSSAPRSVAMSVPVSPR